MLIRLVLEYAIGKVHGNHEPMKLIGT